MQILDPSEASTGRPAPRAVRLVFEYQGSEIRLVSQTRLAMRPSPPHPLVPRENERGSWVMVYDAENRPLYRRVIENPIRTSLEVIAEPTTRVPIREPQGVFYLIVPDISSAQSVALYGEAAETESKGGPVRELGRFKLDSTAREGR